MTRRVGRSLAHTRGARMKSLDRAPLFVRLPYLLRAFALAGTKNHGRLPVSSVTASIVRLGFSATRLKFRRHGGSQKGTG